MTSEPSKAEVLGWMARLGRGASDAADHFWPDAAGPDRTRVVNRIRKWAQVSRGRGEADAPAVMRPAPSGNRAEPGEGEGEPQRPPPDLEAARLPRVEFLERMLADVLADIAHVRALGLHTRPGLVGPLMAQIMEVRAQLDQARQDSGRVVVLDRSLAAVADEVLRTQKRLEQLAARAAEREL